MKLSNSGYWLVWPLIIIWHIVIGVVKKELKTSIKRALMTLELIKC